ncbi:glycine, alanine and asparagine-rich protein isoform X2 [Athalia rosae]|uniref:glycine, alanine and asparagine-rich protein isoform X2 n=1 Tax=Athalia rosae TaxID=37344 RepID=UPI002033A314|nr:glycine, alanine and asparagine-rich protein isoform X2 [Athalia rosae]
MRPAYVLCGLFAAVAVVNGLPIVKREADDLSPLNEADADTVADEERGDRDKRKIGIVKLGVSNGIINFVFGKLDAFLDAKTKAIAVLDEGNKAKNAAFGIDSSQSATSQFISDLISQKIAAGTASIGPLVSGATTFFTSASSGIGNAIASKLGPLSSLAGGLTGGSGGGGLGGGFGGILSSKIEAISGLSSGSNLGGNSGGDIGGSGDVGAGLSLGGGAGGAGGGLNLGAFANLGGATSITTTTEDIPEFDRVHVSLDVPPPVFGGGFNLITNISKVLSSVITNSARRTQNVLEVFKPVFRGAFAIKGLPSDNPK